MDKNSGFLVSYSFCETNDTCLKDAWNYINRGCEAGWTNGKDIELANCRPKTDNCQGFVSSEEYAGTYDNHTWSLGEGASCVVSVDASAYVARVIFDDTSYLGIEYDAKIGDVITIEGSTEEIEIYNGAESGPLHFIISFSGATSLLTGAGLMVAAASTLF